MPINDIPIRVYGTPVGLGQLNEDGSLSIEIPAGNETMLTILGSFQSGNLFAFNLMPQLAPPRPPILPDPEPDPEPEPDPDGEQIMIESVPDGVILSPAPQNQE